MSHNLGDARGKRREFNFELLPEGPDFHRQVWDALLEIPFGETTSAVNVAETTAIQLVVSVAARQMGATAREAAAVTQSEAAARD